jgi:hypothetical protein
VLSRAVYKQRRGRRLLTAMAAVGLVAGTLLTASSVLAVHDAGIFQLDKNASTAVNPAPTALEDWDLICKANPTKCTFAPGYAVPTGTTTADVTSFKVDPSESAQDDILKGGTKDDNDINSWTWASAKPSPPKNDITDGYAAEYTATTTRNGVTAGDKILYFGADRFSNSGSANIAFWFFQHSVAPTPGSGPNGTCTSGSGCPFTGTHTVGNVSLGGNTPGDILVISAFGPKAAINVYEWVGTGNATSPCFTNNCSLEPILVGGQACEDVTNDNACATVNDVSVPSPWVVAQKTGGANQFAPTDFFEGGINLTKLKVDACISSFLINTRASASGDAELHDMISGQFARCTPALTTQASTNSTTVLPGATGIFDRATVQVSGATSPADATGSVTFYLCPAATPNCTSPQVGSGAVTLSNADCDPVSASSTDGKSCAKSATTTAPATPGKYCFRAVADLTNYDDPDAYTDTTSECFTVTQTPTSISTAQSWLPQDSASVTPNVAGTVVFKLYETADCSGTALTFTDSDGSDGFKTNNTTYRTVSTTISWSATFTPTDTNTYSGSTTTRCEKSVITITNDSGPFPPAP